jgi:hypothetical protein
MANEMTMFGGSNKISLRGNVDMAKALDDTAHELGTADGDYISFSGKTGNYSIGIDKADADPNELWLMNVAEIEKGYMCWKGGQPVAQMFASVYGDPVPQPDFDSHGPFNANAGEGWTSAMKIMVKSMDRNMQATFTTSSKSGKNEFTKLMRMASAQIAQDDPCWPLLYLKKEQFRAQGNTNWKPVLEVYEWLSDESVATLSALPQEEWSDAIDELLETQETGGDTPPEVEEEVAEEVAEEAAPVKAEKVAKARSARRSRV